MFRVNAGDAGSVLDPLGDSRCSNVERDQVFETV